jgi:hypothetical protein
VNKTEKQLYDKQYYLKNKKKMITQSILLQSQRRESLENDGEYYLISPTWLLTSTKASAKKKGLEHNIELDDLKIPVLCPLLSIPLTFLLRESLKDSTACVDRIDNSKGYVKGNVWVISSLANRMKSRATLSELRTFCMSVLNRLGDYIEH